MSTADLQDKLAICNPSKLYTLLITGSPISWTRVWYSSDIDLALVNSSMLDKISNYYFVDYPSVSDHKPLVACYKKTIIDESFFFFFFLKKNFKLG